MKPVALFFALGVLIVALPERSLAGPITYNFKTVMSPGDTAFTQLLGINNAGMIAGYFGDGTSVHNNGFTLVLPNHYTTENYPAAIQTQVVGINNNGETVGFYIDSLGVTHGFTHNGTTFTSVTNPNAKTTVTQLLGVNNSGTVAGYWTDASGNFHPFTWVPGTFTPVTFSGLVSAQATDINNAGWVVGFNMTSSTASEGFLDIAGVFTFLQFPGSSFTQALGLNNNGLVDGFYVDGSGNTHGFIYNISTETYMTVDDPNAVGPGGTVINGINDEGEIVGFYIDVNGNTDGFFGAPVLIPPVIAKSFAAPTVPLHSTTSLTLTITNPNAATALSGVAFSDPLPAGLTVISTVGTCGGIVSVLPGSISLSGGFVFPASSCTIEATVQGTAAGVKNNVTSPVTSTQGGTGTAASASITVVAPPTIAKSFAGSTVPLNHSTGLTFDISNPNGTVSLSGMGFTDTLPSGLIVATPNGLSGSCGGGIITATSGSNSISLSGAALGAAATCAFMVNVTGTVAGIQNNTTSVVTSMQGGNGGTASDSITVVAPPTISKSFAAPTVLIGGSTALSFTITNPNPTVALTAVGFTDTLPSGLVVSTPNGLAGSCGGGTITATAGSTSISLSGGMLADSASCTFGVRVTGTTASQQVNTTSAVTSLEGGTGNQASATVTVLATALTNYFSNANTPGAPDGTVRITNPGTLGGNLCANIFVSDANEELSECCSCTVTPDGLLTLSLNTDLTGNPLTGKLLSTGVITIIPAATIGGACPLPTAMTPKAAALRAWATHVQTGETGFVVTEMDSQTTGVSAEGLTALTAQCKDIHFVGSGQGVCANGAALAAICNN